MYDRTGNFLIVAILAGLVLGFVFAAVFGEAVTPVKFLGDIFLNALKIVVIPLMFCSLVIGITTLGDNRKLGRIGLKTVGYYLATGAIAAVIGLILADIFQPDAGQRALVGMLPEAITGGQPQTLFTWFSEQIPGNIFRAAASTNLLPIFIFAAFFGGVLAVSGAKGRPVIVIIDGINEALVKLVHIIMWYAPIGVFGLAAGQLAQAGGIGRFTDVFSGLSGFALVVIIGLLIQAVIVLPLILKFFGGKSPFEYFSGMSQALTTAFATSSSAATLPITMECAQERNAIDKRSASFVLPFGAAVSMGGTAIYVTAAVMFIAQAYGVTLSLWSQILVGVLAVVASVGAAGAPQAGLMAIMLVLQAAGLPLEGIGLILAIDWFLDRCRTTVNVWGDAVGAAVIATTAEIGLVDRRRFKEFKPMRATRIRGFERREEAKGRRKAEEAAPSIEKERPAAPVKAADTFDTQRRFGKDDRRRGRPQEKGRPWRERRSDGGPRPDRPDRPERPERPERRGRPDRPDRPERREGFKPRHEPSAAKPIVHEPAKATPPPPPPPESRPAGGEEARPVFGRKRMRPTYMKPKPPEAMKTEPETETAGAEKPPSVVPDHREESHYEIPKFPPSIWVDLGGKDVGEKAAEKPDEEVSSEPAEEIASIDSDSEQEGQFEDRGDWEPDKDYPDSEADEFVLPDQPKAPVEEIREDFPVESYAPEEPVKESADATEGFDIPVGPLAAEPEDDLLAVDDFEDELKPAEEENPDDEADWENRSDVSETDDEDSGDDEDSSQWGRPKRRRPGR